MELLPEINVSEKNHPKTQCTNISDKDILSLVARERFELSSAAPEAAMFDRCTTGL
jgi:hypothetical protein